ncbi:MAG TPA: PHP domain-containing protein, partial [Steroidobacteraceae bacterium]|nr:PHP domain-containing protein [Steroidobacteraceae bacterium]
MYAELHCLSNFTFLRGASRAEELVERSAQLGYAALAITDECSVAGIVRAHVAARDHALPLIVGSEFRLQDGLRCVLLAQDRTGYGRLCRLITRGRRAAPKGQYRLCRDDFTEIVGDTNEGDRGQGTCPLSPGLLCLWLPGATPEPAEARWLSGHFPTWIAVELLTTGRDRRRLESLQALGRELALPLVAAGDVHMHARGRRALQDVLTATRLGTTVERAGLGLYPNGERHLRPIARIAELHPPELLQATLDIAACCTFSLDELRYEYPREIVPVGHTPASWLRELTEEGIRHRWPRGVPEATRQAIEHELDLIAELAYEPYFLTVHDIVRFARSRRILCQGRGSAANSAVCFCLGITEVDP